MLERAGADVPPDDERAARPARALPRAARARASAPAELVEPIYLRAPGRRARRSRDRSSSAGSSSHDLDAIEEIERASYPTPWSRSMFAGELAKPSLALPRRVRAEHDELVGYLIVSRYVDAWHVMNVAVAPAYRRRGIASRAARAAVRADRRPTRGAATRSRCASRTPARSGSTSGSASRRAASAAATTRTTARTR